MTRYRMEARAKGSKEKYRRVYRHERTGNFIWSGTEYANYARGTKKVNGSITQQEKPTFEKWCKRKGLEFRYSETVEYPTATHYSPNFTRSELGCKCGCVPSENVEANLTKLANEVLEPLRKAVGVLPILSGHRCRAYNTKIGGASKSQHVYGTAFDPNIGNMEVTRAKFIAELKKIKSVNGIGAYRNGGAHGDIRKPPRVEWDSY